MTLRASAAALLVAVLISSAAVHPFAGPAGATYSIPSRSMEPTVLAGDYVHALPQSGTPQRGDLVVFRRERDNVTFLKRLVGLPGDRLQMIDGALWLNGQAVKHERIADYLDPDEPGKAIKRWRETLPNGATYETLDLIEKGFYDNTLVYTVPAGHCFVLGDNRDNSTDSRVMSQIGFVRLDLVIGKPWLVFFSVAPKESMWKLWRWPWAIRWSRLFTRVR